MSGSQARESRRRLVRAFGPEAVDTLNRQGENVNAIEEYSRNSRLLIDQALAQNERLSAEIAALRTLMVEREVDLKRRIQTAEQLADGFFMMPFRARLRWMITGK